MNTPLFAMIGLHETHKSLVMALLIVSSRLDPAVTVSPDSRVAAYAVFRERPDSTFHGT